ncbi:hypothetical protein AO379_0863 [Moraxella catarrhalis]|nr:hypothetical protein AO379_0863 [Moraxella catarrhalis]
MMMTLYKSQCLFDLSIISHLYHSGKQISYFTDISPDVCSIS